MLIHPQFNPVALQLGPLGIHWYGLAYVAALLGGLFIVKRLATRRPVLGLTSDRVDDAFFWITLGVIIGGRLGYVLFYALERYLANPLDILKVWQGGMSFHGGMLGVIVAVFLLCRKWKIHPVDFADRVVIAVPLGLFLGRLANFINGELWGKPVESLVPWAMVFPQVDTLPRHASQLYEAGLEGLVLGGILLWLAFRARSFPRYLASGIFLSGYALARIFVEIFRMPEIVHTVGPFFISQGQLLSLPMLAIGLWMMYLGSREQPTR